MWDTDGNKYLDFCAGIAVNALGHADEQFIKVSVNFHITSPFPLSILPETYELSLGRIRLRIGLSLLAKVTV